MSSRHVIEELNYIVATGVRPRVCNEDFSQSILPLQSVKVSIEDASGSAHAPRLDEQGFVLMPHKTSLANLDGANPPLEDYRAELRELLSDLIDADYIQMANVSPIRRSVPVQDANLDHGAPVPFVHGDITHAGVSHMIPWAYGAVPDRPIKRTALFNFWRLLSPGPTDTPLAVCDARTLAPNDIVAGDSHFLTDGFTFEAVFVLPNPAHRWFYFSQMTRNEVLIFKQFDSDTRYRTPVPHTAFTDHSCPTGAAPRVSIESRAVAYWFDDAS